MSLSRNQEETNYWPSISDMFLVFFVLAMAVASAKIAQVAEGEKYIMEDILVETKLLVKFANEHMEPETTINQPPTFIEDEEFDTRKEEELSQVLEQVYACMRSAWNPSGEDNLRALETEYNHLKANGDSKRYNDCVALMSNLLDLDAKAPADKQLRAINEKVCMGGSDPEHNLLTPEQKEIRKLKIRQEETEKQLAESESAKNLLEQQLESSKKDLNELKSLLKKSEQIESLIQEITHQRELTKQHESNIEKLTQQRHELQQQLDARKNHLHSFNAEVEKRVAQFIKEFKEANRISKSILDERDIAFDPGKSNPHIVGEDNYKKLIDELKSYLMADKKNTYIVEVIGFTDKRSSYELNATLGLERAWTFIDVVYNDLIKSGVSEDLLDKEQIDQRREGARIKFRGYSAGKTLAKTRSLARHAPSRRLEVLISPDSLRQENTAAED